MRLFLITLALYAINGPVGMQIPCAVACIVFVPVWLIWPNGDRQIRKEKKVPDMSYLYGAKK